MDEYQEIRPHIKEFERRVWFEGGLADYIRKAKVKGHCGKAGGYEVLAWAIAGRVMITISKGFVNKDWVSVMVAEDGDRSTMGLHERSMDEQAMITALKAVADNWKGLKPERRVTLDILVGWGDS